MSKQDWDPKYLAGSIKRNIVNPDLIEERAKINFDKQELAEFVISKETLEEMKVINEEIHLNPDLQTDINFLNMTREEQHT